VTVVGLGLIGGSFARALRACWPRLRLVGIDRPEALAAPGVRELVDEAFDAEQRARAQAAFTASDLVFLATPIDTIQGWLGDALASGALVSDCGSTKRVIARTALESPRARYFVPGHPMAGVSGGAKRPSASLFERQPWVLCPEGVEPVALAALDALVRRVGARPVLMSAADHDRAVAVSSHAARLVASALMVVSGERQALSAAGPALEQLSRFAGGDADVWAHILASNTDEIASALEEVIVRLRHCAEELAQGTTRHSLELMHLADEARARLEASRRGE